jgi:hypothetical protein
MGGLKLGADGIAAIAELPSRPAILALKGLAVKLKDFAAPTNPVLREEGNEPVLSYELLLAASGAKNLLDIRNRLF